MRARRYLLLTTLLAAVIMLAGNIAGQSLLAGARLDFTEGKLYTLSDATKETLRDLAEPVELTFVYSRRVGQDYPAIQAHAARVRELLAAYRAASGGNIRVREIDPKPFSEAEDEALAAGVSAIPASGDPLYFGIIGRNTIDDVRLIPFLAPERETTLEYDLTRMVARLDNPEPPSVGILSSLDGMRALGGDSGYTVLQDIGRSFTVEQIPDDFRTLPDVDVLLLAQPPSLTARQEWLIDQFILRHGRAIFVVDPAAKTALTGSFFANSESLARSSLGRLGTAWGVELAPQAVADAANALTVPVESALGRIEEMAHPLFVGVPAETMSRDDPITADLMRVINFGAPGALIAKALPEGETFAPLIMTGPSPSYIDPARAARDMSPNEVLQSYMTEPEPLVIAARLSGELRSAFPNGAPPIDEPADEAEAEAARAEAQDLLPHIAASETPAEIVLVADADFLSDDFYVVPGSGVVVADNGAFLLNALDALAGSGELSRLRSRAASLRPMVRIDEMREAAEDQYFRQQSELESRLSAAQARLNELQSAVTGDGFFAGDPEAELTAAERAELSRLREDILSLRANLRDIERDYRRDIDRLEATLKAINIWGGPLLVTLAGLLVWRRQVKLRRKRA
ncbi:Gldg family protein [Hyphomonas sp. WL0036]|uniref:GldG family protein n=1 Tax=Hyphomonas sediminis TaxID=2866160 RepID=UPI001C7FFA06|nr:GldG family protein [Hyphomonas sediminis]MBY9065879.1 Gldg family protein [Hyphomonas sediminis]